MTPEEIAALPYRPCVGVVLANAAGKVFAGQRIDSDVPAWQMPQGGIDPGEAPEAAALRELWEETGVRADKVAVEAVTPDWVRYDLPADLVGRIWGGKYRGQEQLWYLMRFLGTDADIDIATEHAEFRTWHWMAPAEVLESIVPFKRAVYEQVFDAFADQLSGATG